LLQSSGQKREYSELFYPQNVGSIFLGMSVAVFCLVATIAMKMEAVCTCEMSAALRSVIWRKYPTESTSEMDMTR
jgi:hypothetical protein